MEEYSDDDFTSKTELKRESDRLQALGETLMSLKPADLGRLPLSDRLRHAIDESRRITSHEARRRHAQFVGRVMREDDGERVEAAMTELQNPYRLKWLQDWLERLLGLSDPKGNAALVQEMVERFEHCNRQHLRNLSRNALNARTGDDADNNARDKYRRERKKLSDYINELEKQQPL